MISFSWCGRRAALFFPSVFLCAFLFVFSLIFGLGGVPFWLWVLGAVLFFFSVGLFVCVFVCVFCSVRAFLGSFLALGAGRRAAPFFSRAFCVRFCLCFLFLFGLFWVPFWLWVLSTVLLLLPSGFLCAFLFVFFFFYESGSFIFLILDHFLVFFLKKMSFHFALTFHKCQFVKNTFLFIFIFGLF